MDISLADVMIHIDENLPSERRSEIESRLRQIDGVVSVRMPPDKPHLTIIEYRPDKTAAQALLWNVRQTGAHAELIGL